MEVTYQLEREDYWQYSKFVVSRVPALKRQSVLRFFVTPGILSLDLWLFHVGGYWVWTLIFTVALFGLWAVFLLWSQQRGLKVQLEARIGSIGLHTMQLAPDGFREQNAVMECFVKWSKVTEIAESPQVLVFFLGPRFAFIVPKRAFPSPEQAQAFLQTARAYRDGLASGTAPVLPPTGQVWPPPPQRLV